jgi:hypothetical protein
MKHSSLEKHCLQLTITLACLVPLCAGIMGIVKGAALFGQIGAGLELDSHFRYLSGLLLGLGLCFLSTVPSIERHAARFRLLTAIVLIGGLGRLAGCLIHGLPGHAMEAALVMEILVTPALCLWVGRIASRR